MSYVRYLFTDGLARITLTDPDRGNSITPQSCEQFLAAVRASRRDDARVVVIDAAGKAFCVGGDVKHFAAEADLPWSIEDLAETLHRAVTDLQHGDAIVVSVVQGAAAGAGVPLAAAADLVLAAESATFTLAYTRLGLTPDGGSSQLALSVGLHRALHLALLNPTWTAGEAMQAGLVARVYPDQELASGAEEVVAALLAGSHMAQATAKHLLRQAVATASESALRRESLAIARSAGDPDAAEGLAAFMGKRPPVFPSTGSRSPLRGTRLLPKTAES
jgi:2-(1,2-epoxy-1,2-dihydrophenyl)acetyl-CoA isomerase